MRRAYLTCSAASYAAGKRRGKIPQRQIYLSIGDFALLAALDVASLRLSIAYVRFAESECSGSLPGRGTGRALSRPLKSPDYFALSLLSWVAS